jgi:hypothetical protein
MCKNSIELRQKANKPSLYDVLLRLMFETRHIATLDKSGQGTLLINRKEKHLHRKTNSLGINHQLLTDESIPFMWIVINYAGHKLVTSRLYFLTHGSCYKFGDWDLQCFLPLSEFGLKKAKEFEERQVIQGNLFEREVA